MKQENRYLIKKTFNDIKNSISELDISEDIDAFHTQVMNVVSNLTKLVAFGADTSNYFTHQIVSCEEKIDMICDDLIRETINYHRKGRDDDKQHALNMKELLNKELTCLGNFLGLGKFTQYVLDRSVSEPNIRQFVY